jgi:hypothetical protein
MLGGEARYRRILHGDIAIQRVAGAQSGGVGQPDHITGPCGIQGGALLAEHRLRVLGDERLAGGGVGEGFPAFECARAHPRVGDAIAVGGVHTGLHLENEGAER